MADYQKDIARWDNTWLLAKVARQHFELFLAERGEAERLRKRTPTSEEDAFELEHNIDSHEDNAFQHGLVVVTFCAFALEAHINEYGSRRLAVQRGFR